MSKIKPIFIFSQPRSGSTLLQKIIMSNNKISSFAEPWFLLDLINMQYKEKNLSLYSNETCVDAINDIINNLPNKQNDFDSYIKQFSINIYSNLSKNDDIYFVDKTPRYFLIIDDIIRIFPDAKFIFLFRNPLSIYSSILKTFNKNKFNKIYKSNIDLYDGPKLLSEKYIQYQKQSFKINYENLVNNPESILNELFNYLELDFDKNIINSFFKQDLVGSMGDPYRNKKYNSISNKSINEWMSVFNTRFRKYIANKYINDLPNTFFDTAEYNKIDILNQIKSIKSSKSNIIKELIEPIIYILSNLYNNSKLYFYFSKRFKWLRGKYIS